MFYNSLVNDYRKVTFMLTIKEVAQAANVSVATVSRVLNHDKRVALKTKEHVLKVVKELDYTCLLYTSQRNSRRGRLILHRFCPKPRLHKFKEIKEEIGWH